MAVPQSAEVGKKGDVEGAKGDVEAGRAITQMDVSVHCSPLFSCFMPVLRRLRLWSKHSSDLLTALARLFWIMLVGSAW